MTCGEPPSPGWPISGVLPHVIEAVVNHISGHKGGVAGVTIGPPTRRRRRPRSSCWASTSPPSSGDGDDPPRFRARISLNNMEAILGLIVFVMR